jgi:hypothetical protein
MKPKCQDFKIILKPEGDVKKIVDIEFILDFDWEGELIGIEIINLKFIAGSNCLKHFADNIATSSLHLRYSYDDEVDAFYLKIGTDRDSKYQCSVDGKLILNAKGYIIGFQAKIDSIQ